MRAELDEIAEDFRSEGVFSTATLVESATFAGGVVTTVQALAGEFGDQGPDWQLQTNLPNLDLATLVAYKLARGWEARLTLVAHTDDDQEEAEAYLGRLRTAARLPRGTEIHVARSLGTALTALPRPDLSIFSLPEHPDLSDVRRTVSRVGTSCLFAHDSRNVSALA